MGCFGYMCRCCGKSVRGGEKAALRHIRHGEILGSATGTYDSYGRVEEDEVFRGDNEKVSGLNTHREMCESEFDLEDSIGYRAKIYKDIPVLWMEYRAVKVSEGCVDLSQEMYDEWAQLPNYNQSGAFSGVQAFHKYCFDRMDDEDKKDTTPSEKDPNQSWGKPRKKYL